MVYTIWRSDSLAGPYWMKQSGETERDSPLKVMQNYAERQVELLTSEKISSIKMRYYFVVLGERTGLPPVAGLYKIEKLETYRVIQVFDA